MTQPEVVEVMYRDEPSDNTEHTQTKSKEEVQRVRATETRDVIIVEVKGQRVKLPSLSAYNRLLQENIRLKNEVKRIQKDLEDTQHSMSKLSQDLSWVENELKHKADKF